MGCWPKRLATALLLILPFVRSEMRVLFMGQIVTRTVKTDSPRCGCKAASFCPSNTQNPSLPHSSDYFLLPPFYVAPFRVDDASKEAWHIKRSRVPAADLQWKISNLYIYLAHAQQCVVIGRSSGAAAAAASCTSLPL